MGFYYEAPMGKKTKSKAAAALKLLGTDRLPEDCHRCGGPARVEQVEWKGKTEYWVQCGACRLQTALHARAGYAVLAWNKPDEKARLEIFEGDE